MKCFLQFFLTQLSPSICFSSNSTSSIKHGVFSWDVENNTSGQNFAMSTSMSLIITPGQFDSVLVTGFDDENHSPTPEQEKELRTVEEKHKKGAIFIQASHRLFSW